MKCIYFFNYVIFVYVFVIVSGYNLVFFLIFSCVGIGPCEEGREVQQRYGIRRDRWFEACKPGTNY